MRQKLHQVMGAKFIDMVYNTWLINTSITMTNDILDNKIDADVDVPQL